MKTRPAMPVRWLIGAMLLAGAASVVTWFAARDPAGTDHRIIKLSVDGRSRQAIVFEPVDGQRGERLPLVLAFHGTGQTAEAMADSSGLASWAASRRAVVVFPEARRGMWTTVGVNPEGFADTDDGRFVAELVERLAAEGRIDAGRIYAVGMSNGATFAEMLALAMPDRFAAIAGFAGGLPSRYTVAKTDRPLPVLLLVGDRDEHSAEASVRATAKQLTAAGHDVTLQVLPGQGHRWDRGVNEMIWRFLSRHTHPTRSVSVSSVPPWLRQVVSSSASVDDRHLRRHQD